MKKYIEKYSAHIWGIAILVFFVHGAKLFNGSIGIDTEDIIHLQDKFYGGWLDTGRQGLVFLKVIFDLLDYNPYFAGLLTLIVLAIAVVSWLALFDYTLQKTSPMWIWMITGALWVSHPILVEQLYFSLQSVEICIGMVLIALSLFAVQKGCEKSKNICLLGGIVAAMLAFSLYQVFVPMYIMGTVMILLLQGLRLANEKWCFKTLVLKTLPYMGVFFVAFVLNMFITRTFFQTSDYLSDLVAWGNESVADTFMAIGKHVIRVFTGYHSIHYSGAFGMLCIVTFVSVIFGSNWQRKCSLPCVIFLYLAFCMTPFLLTIICGAEPIVRAQLVLPIVTGSLAYFSTRMLLESEDNGAKVLLKKSWKTMVVVLLLCVIGVNIWTQTQVTMRLYYTDDCRYSYDEALARDLIMRIEDVQSSNELEEKLPVYFVGNKSFEGNNACVQGEIIGKSFFDYDTEVEPLGWWSTRRILGFFHTLGADYEQVGMERIEEAIQISEDMSIWPAQDCVQAYDGMIVVKLSKYE